MAKVILNPSPAGVRRVVVAAGEGEQLPVRTRQILDPRLVSTTPKARKRSGRKKGVGGEIPKPIGEKSNRQFIGIVPGQLATVRGYLNIRWVIITEPSAKFTKLDGEEVEVQSHTRQVGKAVVSVTLMGPDGVQICVPIGWVKPFLA